MTHADASAQTNIKLCLIDRFIFAIKDLVKPGDEQTNKHLNKRQYLHYMGEEDLHCHGLY